MALALSLLSAAYWWIVFTIVYANVLFAGDRNPSGQPLPDHQVLARSGGTIFLGVLIYAALIIVRHRMAKSSSTD